MALPLPESSSNKYFQAEGQGQSPSFIQTSWWSDVGIHNCPEFRITMTVFLRWHFIAFSPSSVSHIFPSLFKGSWNLEWFRDELSAITHSSRWAYVFALLRAVPHWCLEIALALCASKTEKAFRVAFSKFVMNVIGIWETTPKSQIAYGNSDSFNLRTRNVFYLLGSSVSFFRLW